MSIKKAIIEIEKLIVEPDSNLFKPDHVADLELKFIQNKKLGILFTDPISLPQEFLPTVKQMPTFEQEELKWSVAIISLDKIRADLTSASTGSVPAEEEGEAGAEGEAEPLEPQDPDAEEDTYNFEELASSARDKFTYIEKIIIVFNNKIESNESVRKNYNFSLNLHASIITKFANLKKNIRKLSELIGLNGALIILSKLMDRYKFLDVCVRVMGTMFVGTMIIIVIFIQPILRFMANPIQKIMNFFADLFGIKPPVSETDDP